MQYIIGDASEPSVNLQSYSLAAELTIKPEKSAERLRANVSNYNLESMVEARSELEMIEYASMLYIDDVQRAFNVDFV